MQLRDIGEAVPVGMPVSILIQPEGRMQPHRWDAGSVPRCEFQSSSSQKAGCNHLAGSLKRITSVFQSSSSQKAGCNLLRY